MSYDDLQKRIFDCRNIQDGGLCDNKSTKCSMLDVAAALDLFLRKALLWKYRYALNASLYKCVTTISKQVKCNNLKRKLKEKMSKVKQNQHN